MSRGSHMKLEVEWASMDLGHETPCIISLYTPKSTGYCVTSVNGVRDYAHRHAYRAAHGCIPEGRVIDHLCHGPNCDGGLLCMHRRCANPDHLALSTHSENIRRGRNIRLNEATVAGLRLLVGANAATDRVYADMYGVRPHAIYTARTGRSWR